MSFAAVLPAGGLAGWSYLKRTGDIQIDRLARDPTQARDEAYFRQKIGSIGSAEELVADRRLLKVALGAFGLEGDINNRFFIRKVLEEGTLTTDALATRLADKQYRKFSAAFGFGDFSTPRTKLSDFADKIIAQYRSRSFETAVGAQDETLRLALNARRDLAEIAASGGSADQKWYSVLGSLPLRKVVQGAFGLPSGFASLDLDRQVDMLRGKAAATFGEAEVAQFADPARLEKLLQRFILRTGIADYQGSNAGGGALVMLQQTADFARSLRRG